MSVTKDVSIVFNKSCYELSNIIRQVYPRHKKCEKKNKLKLVKNFKKR